MPQLKMKGAYFAFEPRGEDEVCITWSMNDTPSETWDPLDFWIVPKADVDTAVERLRKGIEL